MAPDDLKHFLAATLFLKALEFHEFPCSEQTSNKVLFVEKNRQKVFQRVLNGMALLLSSDPSNEMACSMHFTTYAKVEIFLLAAYQKKLSAAEESKVHNLVSKITQIIVGEGRPHVGFLPRNLGPGSHPDEEELANIILPYCCPRIHRIISGGEKWEAREKTKLGTLYAILAFMRQRGCCPSDFQERLHGRRFANSTQIHQPNTQNEAYLALCAALHELLHLAETLWEDRLTDSISLYQVIVQARWFAKDEVFIGLCTKVLSDEDKTSLISFVEKLGGYGIALRSLVGVRKTYWRLPEDKHFVSVKFYIMEAAPVQDIWLPNIEEVLAFIPTGMPATASTDKIRAWYESRRDQRLTCRTSGNADSAPLPSTSDPGPLHLLHWLIQASLLPLQSNSSSLKDLENESPTELPDLGGPRSETEHDSLLVAHSSTRPKAARNYGGLYPYHQAKFSERDSFKGVAIREICMRCKEFLIAEKGVIICMCNRCGKCEMSD